MVDATGLEPVTPSMSRKYSNQLSYAPEIHVIKNRKPRYHSGHNQRRQLSRRSAPGGSRDPDRTQASVGKLRALIFSAPAQVVSIVEPRARNLSFHQRAVPKPRDTVILPLLYQSSGEKPITRIRQSKPSNFNAGRGT